MKVGHALLSVSLVLGSSVPTQPNAHDQEWVRAPREVLEEMKAGHLTHHYHPHHRHTGGAALLSQHASEGTMTGKILGDIGTAEEALKHALQGAPEVLQHEENLLKQASFMATQAGHYQAQEKQLSAKMSKSGGSAHASHASSASKVAAQERSLKALTSRQHRMMKESQQVLAMTGRARAAVEKELGGSETGNKVAELLGEAQAAERQAARSDANSVHVLEHMEASFSATRARKQRLHHMMAHSSKSTHGEHASLLSKFASEERSLRALTHSQQSMVKESRQVLAETGRAEAAVEEELGGTDAGNKVAELLEQAQADERQAAKSDMNSVHTLEHMQASFMATKARYQAQQRRSAHSQQATLLSKFAREERSLRALANRRQSMAKKTRHVLAETGRAEAAIEEQLGGTDAGNQVAELLEQAQAAERQVATGSQKVAKLSWQDVNSVRSLEHLFKNRVHV